MRPMTILVIEDVDDVQDVIAHVLSHAGYHILPARRVPEAKTVRKRIGLTALGVVITDLRLTRHYNAREGADLIRRWHLLAPRLPFILMSGDVQPHTIQDLPASEV
jgi:DNA-binding NtrC family response regulator